MGGLIGNERGRHGRAAGMRTHMTGDIFRISAQVVCGVGFLGAGMIILKNNSVITGLTTAAEIWTTSIIGMAIVYIGAITAAVFCLGLRCFCQSLRRGENFLLHFI